MRRPIPALFDVSWRDQVRSPITRTIVLLVPLLSLVVWYLPDRFDDRYPLKLAWAHPLAGAICLLVGLRFFADRASALLGVADQRFVLGCQQSSLHRSNLDLFFAGAIASLVIPLVAFHLFMGYWAIRADAEVTSAPRWTVSNLVGPLLRIVIFWTSLAYGAFALSRVVRSLVGRVPAAATYASLLIGVTWWIEGDAVDQPLQQPSTSSCVVAALVALGLQTAGAAIRRLRPM